MNKHCNAGKCPSCGKVHENEPTVWIKIYDAVLCVLLGLVGVYGIAKAMGWV